MFKTFRKLFGRRDGGTADALSEIEQGGPFSNQGTGAPKSVRVDAQAAAVARPGNAPSSLGVPLKSIIARLPADLMQRVRQLDVGEAEIFIPTQRVLSQISTGAVRISFGELRQLAPPGAFTPENDRDRYSVVELPLYEILARLNPGLLTRRPAQKHVEVPEDVVGPFGGQNKVTISTKPLKSAAPARPPAAAPAAPAPLRAQPVVAAPVQPLPRFQPSPLPVQPVPAVAAPVSPAPRVLPGMPSIQPVFARIRPAAQPARPAPTQPVAPIQPATRPAPAEEVAEPVFNRLGSAHAASPVQPVYTPIAPAAAPKTPGDTEIIQMPENYRPLPPTTAPITPIAPEPEPEPQPIRFSGPPEKPVMPVVSGETRFITVSISELSESWPEALRNEINAQKLSGSWIGLPLAAVEGVIKTGKIAFPWKALRSWVKPPIPAAPSPYDTTIARVVPQNRRAALPRRTESEPYAEEILRGRRHPGFVFQFVAGGSG